jgi:hypothetical protein
MNDGNARKGKEMTTTLFSALTQQGPLVRSQYHPPENRVVSRKWSLRVRKKYATILLLFGLAGCASGGTQVLHIPDSAPEAVTITWARVTPEEVEFYCDRAPRPMGAKPLACAINQGPRCFIYTTREASLELIGHEVAHCYLGNWH